MEPLQNSKDWLILNGLLNYRAMSAVTMSPEITNALKCVH